ncbi:isochorismatase family protein [Mesorhizobium sp. LHD-90]|uniref:isochorismatase family protein n=1 Tax=Mesorhizobium sp. LHD-90 TaxID=3071414 RepID=UPI0027DEE03A|nr:isochorismatase family protein [Mesorhizobium sp. LHD-90]MDQ6435460.1 isochorismatase family protein [Mesorhizobium sp. LHD-90]
MHKPLALDLSRTALLCIDLQEEHRRDSRYLVEGFGQVLANVARLQQAARDAGVPVLHSAYIVDSAGDAMRPLHPVMADGRSAFSNAGDPWTALCSEVAPLDGEDLRIKANASTFSRTDFAPFLRERGIEWLIVVGVWTEACVAASVKDAVDLGLRVALVKDACGSGSAAIHETAILNLANRLYGGAVIDTRQALNLLAGGEVAAWQIEGSVPLRYTFENASQTYNSL